MNQRVPVIPRTNKKRIARNRTAIASLTLLFIILVAVLFDQSGISKITEIVISGNEYTSSDEIIQSSGVAIGTSFYWGASKTDIANHILSIKPIKSVTVKKQFPGKVHISIEEYPFVAYDLTNREVLFSNGSSFFREDNGNFMRGPLLTGWSDPILRTRLCEVLAELPQSLMSNISQITPAPSKSYEDKIKIYTSSNFEIFTTISSVLKNKDGIVHAINAMEEPGVITSIEESLTYYEPFSNQN